MKACSPKSTSPLAAIFAMILWRISTYETLDGRGGLFASARWHTRGRPVVYLANSAAGALVEVLVHLELDPAQLPRSYTLLKADAADDISIERIDATGIQQNWRENTFTTRSLGDEWLLAGKSALLEVPSAILPETVNVLLNPLHPEAPMVRVLWHEAYPYDRGLFKGR
jgi:RES domain-containing protein